MRRFLFLAPILSMAFYMAVVAGPAKAAETGTLVVVEQATCASQFGSGSFGCEAFFFHGTGAIGDFSLSAVRPSRTSDQASFDLAPGVFTVTQYPDTSFPLTGINCTSNGRRLNLNTGTNGVNVDLRAGEVVTCVFTNSAPTPTPTATPTSTATATPTATATATPIPPTVVPATPSATPQPVVVIVNVPPAPVAPVATAAPAQPARITPPSTGDAGLAR